MPLTKQNVHINYQRLHSYLMRLAPDISEISWRFFEGAFDLRTYHRNQLILRQGDPCEYVWFINRGIVEKYYVINGKERVNDLVTEENFFSDFNGFLFQLPSNLGIRAIEETETLRISYSDVQRLYASTPETDRLGRLIAEKMLVSQSQRIAQLTLLSPEERYREYLASNPGILLRVPQYLIASYLSLTPESLSRIRARFKKNH